MKNGRANAKINNAAINTNFTIVVKILNIILIVIPVDGTRLKKNMRFIHPKNTAMTPTVHVALSGQKQSEVRSRVTNVTDSTYIRSSRQFSKSSKYFILLLQN